jgi:hypothetical protein
MLSHLALLLVPRLDPSDAARLAGLALACVHLEYPNKIAHVMNSDADALRPRDLTPAFYGCYDWHSSVHGHWLLARVARLYPNEPIAVQAREALARSISPPNIAKETDYFNTAGRATFERPYGQAWLLALALELREMNSPLAQVIAPLEQAVVARLSEWLPKLSHPVRSGEHSQTAFALGLALDCADVANPAFASLIRGRAQAFYSKDQACPAAYEPSGEDFLSPCLAEADLMRRVLDSGEFAKWLDRFLPSILPYRPLVVTDPTDGKLAHLDGLNLSRGWMLTGIASALPSNHPRRAAILRLAAAHGKAGLAAATGEHYEGGHWLGSFAVYYATGRGLR